MAQLFKTLINPTAVRVVAEAIQEKTPAFPAAAFVASALPGLDALELKARANQVAVALFAHLPKDWPAALAVLLGGMGPPLPDAKGVSEGFRYWPILTVVERYGLAHPEASLDALREMTRRFSAEFAVRPYLLHHPELAWAKMNAWTADPDVHVRRLASEGSRPRLPWGMQLRPSIDDPGRNLELIEKLKDDPEAYVRRSVANHLNDVARDHPQKVVAIAQRWAQKPARIPTIRHGLRTLLKNGDPKALAVMGYLPPQIRLETFSVTPASIRLGSAVSLRVALRSTQDSPQPLMVDFAVGYVRKKGPRSFKVFKGSVVTLAPKALWQWEKSVSIKPVTTRRHYPGEHHLRLLVNGKIMGEGKFMLSI